MKSNYNVHIFKSNSDLPSYAPDEFNRLVGPKSNEIMAPFMTSDYLVNAYLFGRYTKEDHEKSQHIFDEDNIGFSYLKLLTLWSGNASKAGEACGFDCWARSMLLPNDPASIEEEVGELLKSESSKAPIIEPRKAMIVWAYHSLVDVLENAFDKANLNVIKHYKSA